MEKCNYCGKEVEFEQDGNDRICPECGWEADAARNFRIKAENVNNEILNKKTSKKKRPIVIAIIALALFVFIIPQMCPSGGSSSSSYTSVSNTSDIVVLKDAFAGVSKSDLDKVIKFSVARDSDGLMQFMLYGHAFMISNGTKARVISRGFSSSEVRLIDGDLSGRSGWIPNEMIR